ncbi:argonaute/piwi family protein [Novosphingobium sp.]|uniref:argonaute/piwi family protein n=1 Tax=Novosphingobium sp. TaxID=1874826 RepID=UPI003B52283E
MKRDAQPDGRRYYRDQQTESLVEFKSGQLGHIGNECYSGRVKAQLQTREHDDTGSRTAASGPFIKQFSYSDGLSLNLAPVSFSQDTFEAGRTPYEDDAQYRGLREKHQATHAFRYDVRDRAIYDIAMVIDAAPLGAPISLRTQEHLALLGKAVNHALLEWLTPRRTILRRARPLQALGSRKAALLSAAIRDQGLEAKSGLDVLVRHSFDLRVLGAPHHASEPYLALVLDVSTSNELDISLDELLKEQFDPRGCYICTRADSGEANVLARLETLGRILGLKNGKLQLNDFTGEEFVNPSAVILEPRQENLEALIRHFYPRNAPKILQGLRKRRAPYATANAKLAEIRKVHGGVAGYLETLRIAGMSVEIGALLQRSSTLFPPLVSTERPGFLFGPQGRETGAYPDHGIKQHGPYKYMQHERNEPIVAVICESRFRGRIDQLARTLRDGADENAWQEAMRGRSKVPDNPFRGGLIGKLRLSRVQFEFEEVTEPTPEAYRQAIQRLLARLPETPDLALVQVRADFKQLRNERNPYFAAKAAFMTVGVPVQSVQAETADMQLANLAYMTNNLALAAYAKLGGSPFVISTRMPATHELVVGLGYTEVSEGRFGPKSRFVGITTVFQGDGRYLVWGQTREVEFENYADALLASLKTTIDSVRKDNNWQPRDRVRLVFHVYKPLKHIEIHAIKRLVAELLKGEHEVEFAFLDISRFHDFALFDPSQEGVTYYADRRQLLKGVGVPLRGICIQLDQRSALLQLTGSKEVKTAEQGLPRPLRLTLHPDSDFSDLTYLARQVYHFSYLSWRSYFPALEPVSITYSRLIANALGNLRSVPGWNSTSLTVGHLRSRMWFL